MPSQKRTPQLLLCSFLALILLSACALPFRAPAAAPAADEMPAAEAPAAEAAADVMPAAAEEAPIEAPAAADNQAAPSAESAASSLPSVDGAEIAFNLGTQDAAPQPAGINRKIIKNGEIQLQVADTDVAIDRITQLASDAGGYIVSSRTWFQNSGADSYKYATITLGVPADQFEPVLRQLRAAALRVLNETASGEDVTDQFVDLQSRLDNLKVTRDRVRTFLDRAETVEEALKVNEDLAEIEDEIANVQGRINYLSGRSSYSTIVANIQPDIPPTPTPTSTATPTPTPTPTPTATPVGWNPGGTVAHAGESLRSIYQGVVDVLIWVAIVVLPVLVPILLVVWLVWRFGFARMRKPE